eukprot:SAG22_NODE_1149_length_5353_cov_1.820898_5_plen_88_part_00
MLGWLGWVGGSAGEQVLPASMKLPHLLPGQDPATFYGESAAGGGGKDGAAGYSYHLEELAPAVDALKQLETDAQQSYFALRQQFRRQ